MAALAVVVVIYLYWVKVEHRLTVVTPGRAYQSAAMPPEDMVRVAERLGVETVFDFRGETPDELRAVAAEHAALTRAGINHVHLPSSTHPAPETVSAFVRAMRPEVDARHTVLLHCHDGEGRAVFYSAIYRMEFEGWNNEQAYNGTTRLPPSLMFLRGPFPELMRMSASNVKTPMILAYKPHQDEASAGGIGISAATPPN